MGEVVVAQLVGRLLPIPEDRGSNPVIGKNLLISNICILSTVYWKDENKEKEAGNGPFLKKDWCINNYWPPLFTNWAFPFCSYKIDANEGTTPIKELW